MEMVATPQPGLDTRAQRRRSEQARRYWQDALAIYTELRLPEADGVRANLDGLDSRQLSA
jgi:hypothetical protein